MIGFSFTVWTKKSAKKERKQVRGCLQNLYQSVAEVRTFSTLITSTKVFSLIIRKLFDKTILYLEIVDSIHKQDAR